MSEQIEERFRLTVETIEGFDSLNRPILSGNAGSLDVNPEYARVATEAIRAYAAERLDWWLSLLLVSRHGDPDRPETKLDFTAPNGVTRSQLEELLKKARNVVDALEVLHELAPWTYDDEDDDDPSEPSLDPDPEPAETA